MVNKKVYLGYITMVSTDSCDGDEYEVESDKPILVFFDEAVAKKWVKETSDMLKEYKRLVKKLVDPTIGDGHYPIAADQFPKYHLDPNDYDNGFDRAGYKELKCI